MDFENCLTEASFLLGTTTFPVADIKRLDVGDIVLFENSNSSEMTLMCENIVQKFKVNPNTKIVEPYDPQVGGTENMAENTNLWDSIQVDMSAEFDKVKVSLGELKSIEEGLIVDLCSVYDNKVSLKVSGKTVANGELVIINDRFGVRIEHVNDSSSQQENHINKDVQQESGDGGDDFDYSDFEVDENEN